MNWNPLFDRLLIQTVAAQETVGGLSIPESADNLKRAVVVKAGPGRPGSPMAVKEGQQVLYKKEDATAITLDDKQYFIIEERNAWMNGDE